jgi:hypothetical protein
MRKYLFPIFIIFFYSLQSHGQNEADYKIISNLKIKLKNLKGNEKTDCLNELALEYKYLLPFYKDSMSVYAWEANKLAKQLNYKKGTAQSLTFIAFYYFAVKKDSATAEKYFKESESIGKEIDDNSTLGWNYLLWSDKYLGNNYLLKLERDPLYIELLKKANFHFQKAGDERGEVEASTWLCLYYLDRGNAVEAFQYCERTVALSHVWSDRDMDWKQVFGTLPYANMSQIFEAAGDYETAMDYLRQGKEYDRQYNTGWEMSNSIGMLYCKMNRADSAIFYLRKDYDSTKKVRPRTKIALGTAYILNNEYDIALRLLKSAVDSLRTVKRGEVNLPWGLIELAKAYEGKKNYKAALKYAQEGFRLAVQRNRNRTELTMNGAEVLSRLFHQLKRNDSAYIYLLQYTLLKDSVTNKQNLWRLNIKLSNYKKEAAIGFLQRDNKIKEQQLKQESQLKYFLLFGLLAAFIIGFFIFRSQKLKRKNDLLAAEKTKAELQQKVSELEMQALRAQMNPHFIFNCLSSINRFIFKNDNKAASDYLTRFSRLIRMVLMNTSKKLITLEDELEMLRLYLDLERLRFKDAFDYSITTTNIVDAGAIFIPPLLLQPFCENAVWHGLMHKESKGHLNVIISEVIVENEKVLHCVIEDDGVGREKAAEMKSKSAENEKSLGLKITTERLALLNQENNFSTFYKIEDILNENNEVAGTRVQLKIRHIENIEELV